MEFTPQSIKEYNTKANKRHVFYKDTVKRANALDIHFSGAFPTELILDRRPSESEIIQKYREKIFVPITKPTVYKVYNALMKIRRSNEWGIKFNETLVPSIIASEETPQEYINEHLPYYGSLTNWCFNILLKQYLVDANLWVVTMPLNFDKADNEYLKPTPFIFNSESIIDYELDKWVVIKSDEIAQYGVGNNLYDGVVYYTIDTEAITRYEQYNNRGDFKISEGYPYMHGLGYCPAHMIHSIIDIFTLKNLLCESRLTPMLPNLDEAVREYSDLQAVIVQHAYPKMWMYETQDCGTCRGLGLTKSEEGLNIPCQACGGGGKKMSNPYDIHIVKPSQADEQPTPTPSFGYVTIDTAIVDIQDKRINEHQYKALGSINMQFLDMTPLNQSGTAKEVDKDELKSFYHAVAEDLVRMLDLVARDIITYRYGGMVTPQVLEELMPSIRVPEKFDTLTQDMLIGEYKAMKDAGVSADVLKQKQIDIISKEYQEEGETREILVEKLQLDPLYGLTDDTIQLGVQQGTIQQADAILHYNIGALIDKVAAANTNYFTLDKEARKQLVLAAAQQLVPPPPLQLNG